MKTLGVGVDIVENSRIKKSISNKKFLLRIFTNNEIAKSKKITDKTAFFSKRFAAKEAFSKALGTGFRDSLNFKDIIDNSNLLKAIESRLYENQEYEWSEYPPFRNTSFLNIYNNRIQAIEKSSALYPDDADAYLNDMFYLNLIT